jgi:hypothetical protein
MAGHVPTTVMRLRCAHHGHDRSYPDKNYLPLRVGFGFPLGFGLTLVPHPMLFHLLPEKLGIRLGTTIWLLPVEFSSTQWAMTDSNRRHPACKAGALDQLS